MLAELGGRPLVARVAANMLAVGGAEVLVVTDDARVAAAAREAGAGAWLSRRPAESGSDRIRQYLDDSRRAWPELVVNVQGDEPLLEGAAVRELVTHLRGHPSARVATLLRGEPSTAERIDPNVVKGALRPDGTIEEFARLPLEDDLPVGSAADLDCRRRPRWLVHVGVYAFRAEAFRAFTDLPPSGRERREHLEQLRMLDAGIAMHGVVHPTSAIGVDTPEDLERARSAISAGPRPPAER